MSRMAMTGSSTCLGIDCLSSNGKIASGQARGDQIQHIVRLLCLCFEETMSFLSRLTKISLQILLYIWTMRHIHKSSKTKACIEI